MEINVEGTIQTFGKFYLIHEFSNLSRKGISRVSPGISHVS